jgi:hypothetical protein
MAVAAVTVITVMAVDAFTVITVMVIALESKSGHGPSMFHRRYRDRKVGSAHQCFTSCRPSCGIERKRLREL